MTGWRERAIAAITAQAPPPDGTSIGEIEEDRQAITGSHCRECGDVGAGVVIDTSVVADGPASWHYYRAVHRGDLADLLDELDAGTLTLAWERQRI